MTNSNENSKKFEPQPHLEQRDGLDYLPLKWRLAWLRHDQPQAQVMTRLVSHENGLAIFQAKIKVPGGGVATGWGASTHNHPDQNDSRSHEFDLSYITEAENQALERALTVLGYGVEYASDFDMPVENEGIALNVVTLPTPTPEPAKIVTPVAPNREREGSNVTETRNFYQAPPPREEPAPDTSEAEEDADEVDTEEEITTQPTNIRSVNRPPAPSTTSRPPANVTPLPNPAANRGGLSSTPRPLNRPTPTGTTATIGSPAVNERIKGIEDSALVLAIKQIYYQARSLYNLDEDKVDQRSIRSYGVPAYELNLEQAEEFLERIKNSPRKNQ